VKKLVRFLINTGIFTGLIVSVGAMGAYEIGVEFSVFLKTFFSGVVLILISYSVSKNLKLE
jgi:hypothetical protein